MPPIDAAQALGGEWASEIVLCHKKSARYPQTLGLERDRLADTCLLDFPFFLPFAAFSHGAVCRTSAESHARLSYAELELPLHQHQQQ